MIKIGLVGENPSDTKAIENLLSKEQKQLTFVHLLYGITTGDMLESPSMKNLLRVEIEEHEPDIVLFIRDLDRLKSDKDYKKKLQERKSFYTKMKRVINRRKRIHQKDSLFLLNIYTIEALILSDISVCNKYLNANIELDKPAMEVEKPIELLRKYAYKEHECPKIFAELRIEVLQQNCAYFDEFMQKWEKWLEFHSNP